MSIQDSINKALNNLQWAYAFYQQTPQAQHNFQVKQARKNVENLRNTPSREELEEQELDVLRQAGTLSDATMGPALQRAHKQSLSNDKAYLDATQKLYDLDPTLENRLALEQARGNYANTRSLGASTVESYKAEAQRKIAMAQPDIQYNEPIGPQPEAKFRAQYEQNQPSKPNGFIPPESVREKLGAEMIARIKQQVDREQFRETSRVQLNRINSALDKKGGKQ